MTYSYNGEVERRPVAHIRSAFRVAQVLGDWPSCVLRLQGMFLMAFPNSWHVSVEAAQESKIEEP